MFLTERQRKSQTNLGSDPRQTLDPDKLYRESFARSKANSTGVGKLVFEFIPFSIIRSFALAIDPLKKFRGVPVKITPVNRTRYRERTSVLDLRKYKHTRNRLSYISVMWASIGGPPGLFCYSPPLLQPSSGVTVIEQGTHSIPKQVPSIVTTKDTTARTRPMGSDFGEFEHFSYEISSPSLHDAWYQDDRWSLTMQCNNQISWLIDYHTRQDQGPYAVMSKASLDGLLSSAKTELQDKMQDKVLPMLKNVVPTSRRYTAFRNVVELKDVPRAVLSLQHACEALKRVYNSMSPGEKAMLLKHLQGDWRHIPSEYVSFHFGWKQILKDIFDLVEKPVRAAREVNRLMRRSGQPTTFRTFSRAAGSASDSPPFTYPAPSPWQKNFVLSTKHQRQHELRLVVNATFDFPKIGIPDFRRDLFIRKMGVVPTPTDVYNLVPWTWLFDWFTGLGNYVEAIDAINTDPSLINWGLLTGITKGKITTTCKYEVSDIMSGSTNHVPFSNASVKKRTHESVCDYTLHLRKNITSAYDVKTILEPSSLNLYQQSILAAILASRRRF